MKVKTSLNLRFSFVEAKSASITLALKDKSDSFVIALKTESENITSVLKIVPKEQI